MLNKIKFAVTGAAIAAAMVSTAARADTETATASVQIVSAVELTTLTNTNFGAVASGSTAGTVALTAGTNARSCTGGTTCIGAGFTRGSFQVSNAGQGATVQLSVAKPATLTGPGTAIVVNSLSLSAASIVFDSASLETVYVGGSLAIGASQTAGVYSGTYTITADY